MGNRSVTNRTGVNWDISSLAGIMIREFRTTMNKNLSECMKNKFLGK